MSRIGVCSAPDVHAGVAQDRPRHADARSPRVWAFAPWLTVQSKVVPGPATWLHHPARSGGAWHKLLSTDFESADPGLKTSRSNSKDAVTSRYVCHRPVVPKRDKSVTSGRGTTRCVFRGPTGEVEVFASGDFRISTENRGLGAFRRAVDVQVMGRPRRLPERGDISTALVAQRLGLSTDEFNQCRAALEKRGFPEPDATTGLYAIEAIDRWRLRRYPRLFPELAGARTALDAHSVFEERLGRIRG